MRLLHHRVAGLPPVAAVIAERRGGAGGCLTCGAAIESTGLVLLWLQPSRDPGLDQEGAEVIHVGKRRPGNQRVAEAREEGVRVVVG